MIGVLDLQGAVSEHLSALNKLGQPALTVKSVSQLAALKGLIIPGGESTTLRRLLNSSGLFSAIQNFAHSGGAVFGTCAGLVLCARTIIGGDQGLDLIDITVQRNGFGRQQESFETQLPIPCLGEPAFDAVFIRAPYIEKAGSAVQVLACCDGKIVAARQNKVLVTAFHPELSDDLRLLEYFVNQCVYP
ncbi:MAG: pyridoxal 5'-phosphate synthase glutaminase subunit PdxT [Enterobacteriaceae bacterium]